VGSWTAEDLLAATELPEPSVLRRRHVALLLIDEGLGGPACFSWRDDAPNGPLAQWENHSGDHYFARFWPDQALLWGLDHESPMSPWAHPDEPDEWPGMTRGLPPQLREVLDAEPNENYRRSVSFCFFHDGRAWHRTDPDLPAEERLEGDEDPQGARSVLRRVMDRSAADRHVADYHERPDLVDAAKALIDAVEAGAPLTPRLVAPIAEAAGAEDLLRRASALQVAVAVA
jgi:hypothetical protein